MGLGGPRQEAQVVQDLPPHARKIKGEVCTPLKHLYSVETRSYCPQTFLSLDSQVRGDDSELKKTVWD